MKHSNVAGARACYERGLEALGEDANTVRAPLGRGGLGGGWVGLAGCWIFGEESSRARRLQLSSSCIPHSNCICKLYLSSDLESVAHTQDSPTNLKMQPQTKPPNPTTPDPPPNPIIQEEFFMAFAEFEEHVKEPERARAIYKYALDHLPKQQAQALYARFVTFEKQHGDRAGIEDVVLSKRRCGWGWGWGGGGGWGWGFGFGGWGCPHAFGFVA